MTQSPFDSLAKQYLEDFLTPIGTVEREYEIPGESKFVDVWFTPYILGPGLHTKLVSIDQLPKNQATLWIRILVRGETQTLAIQEVVNLPSDHPRRERILRLLAAWKVRIYIGEV
jgi:hypothetical protein